MSDTVEVLVPDLGDFADIEVVEVIASAGDALEEGHSLLTLESEKASVEVPAPHAGRVERMLVKAGDRVSAGTPIALMRIGAEHASTAGAGDSRAAGDSAAPTAPGVPTAPVAPGLTARGEAADIEAELLVLGGGPGGYSAAFRAADLGLRTVLVERHERLGGVCLNVGCIPSKALLHSAEVIEAARALAERGIGFADPEIDVPRLARWKDGVVRRLCAGLAGLARRRQVQVVTGRGEFESAHRLRVRGEAGPVSIAFGQAIIAAGSRAASLPDFPDDDPRVMDSSAALALEAIPERLLIVGGGIIGLEMAGVYHALGSRVNVVELMPALMPGCDPDLVAPLARRIERQYESIRLETRVSSLGVRGEHLEVRLEDARGTASSERFDRVLVAIGRRPNGRRIGAERAGVEVDEAGFIAADREQRTNVAHIFAIGDIAGEPMLAHKATHQGKVAAEVAAGHASGFDARCIPSVAYTDPEVAWTGLRESDAKRQGLEVESAVFPWSASGRALGMARSEGLTKLIFDAQSRRLLGAGLTGPHAGELIAEATLAIEMGADAADIGLSIHPHPTLSETLGFAAEMAEGTVTDLYLPRQERASPRSR